MENNMGNNIIKVLAIDDIQDNLISLKALVYEAYPNALIYTALNGEKGIELAKTADPDVILLDIVMPEMDGFEVCKKLKQDRVLSDIPVVFVTALKGDSENRIYALECGAEAFLAKPIDPSELKAQIRAMMKIKTANVDKRDEKERLAKLVAEQTRELQVTHKITLDLLDDIRIENESRKISEIKYRNIFENIIDVYYETTIDGIIIEISPSIKYMTGDLYSRENLIGKSILQFYENSDKRTAFISELQKKGFIHDFEVNLQNYDGKKFSCSITSKLIYNEQGIPDKIIGTMRNISERKLQEETLRENEERFRAVSEYSFNSICIVNEVGKIVWANEAMLNMGGYSREQIYAVDTFASFIAPESLDFVLANFIKFVQGEEYIHHYEFYFIRANGEIRLGEKHMSHFKDRLGNMNLVISMMDITERKNAEINLEFSNTMLKSQQEASRDGILIVNETGGIISYNQRFVEIWGISQEIIDSKSDEKALNSVLEKLANPKEFIEKVNYLYNEKNEKSRDEIILKNNSVFDRYSAPIITSDGNYHGRIWYFSDITERKNAEDAIRRVEAIQHKMIANIGDVVAIIDKNGINTYKSPNLEKWFGWKPEEVVGNSTWDLVHPDDLEASQQFMGSLASEANATGTTELRYLCKNGNYSWIEFTAVNLLNDPDINGILGNYHDISERKQAELLLKESEQTFRNYIDYAPHGIFVANEKGEYIDVNSAACKITGYSKDELLTMKIIDLIPEESSEKAGKHFQKLLNEGNSYEELGFIKKNKTQGFLTVNAIKLSDHKFLGFVVDVTGRKLDEEKLKKSEEKFSKAFKVSPESITIASLNNGKYIEVNDVFLKTTGFNREEVIGKTSTEIKVWANNSDRDAFVKELINNKGALINYETIFRMKNGEIRNFILSTAIIELEGELCSLNFITDITERKQAEEALKESEEKFRLLYTSMNQGLALHEIILDKNGNPIDYVFLDINETYTKLLGVTREMSIGKRIREVMPKVEQYWINIFGKVALTGEPMYYENYLETTNRYYSTYSYSPKKNQFAVLVSDITDRKNSEIQLKEKNEELTIAKEKAEESDRLKTSFLQNMSHEIRTPMNAIMGFSHLLVGQYNNRPKLEEYTEIIKQRCNDLLDIINDILDIAKIESGQIKINEEECNIKDLFSELLTFFEPIQKRLEKEDITLNLLFDNDLSELVFQSDKGKLKQIFINLINNAFKFTDEGSINVSCKINNNYLIFNVSDTGLGIPEDKKNKIFERFYQIETDYTRIYGGNGLGLSIVKGLVELLGGEIIVESQLKIGSTFSFTIPFKPVKSKKIQELSDETNSEYYFPNKTILIVEDDNSNAIYLKVILEDTGTILSFAKNGTQAIEMALAQDFDIILMDIGLPDISGYEATQFLIKNNPNLKIIAQTAFASADDQQNAYNAGCIDFLSKPMQVDSLLKTLNKYL